MNNRKKPLFLLLLIGILFISPLSAAEMTDISNYPSCQYCGMDRHKFAHSRMLVEYNDGSSIATCSIHCAAIDLAKNIGTTPATLQVGDYNNQELIDAESAIWVLGGDRPGVMTTRAKWAFSSKEAAAAFVTKHGGKIVSFDTALKGSYEDMYTDTGNIRKKRQERRMKMNQIHTH